MTTQSSARTNLKTEGQPRFPIWLILIWIAALVITLVLIAYFASKVKNEDNQDQIPIEIVSSLLQLAVVILIGGAITALFRTAEQRRDQSRARTAVRADFLTRLGSAYRSVKSARRALIAGGLTAEYGSPPDKIEGSQAQLYREEMKRIDAVQLALEELKIEAKSLPPFIPMGNIADNLETMEGYLRQILHEYEKNAPLLESREIAFRDLEWLNEFTGDPYRPFTFSEAISKRKRDYRFITHFANPYDDVIAIISPHLLL